MSAGRRGPAPSGEDGRAASEPESPPVELEGGQGPATGGETEAGGASWGPQPGKGSRPWCLGAWHGGRGGPRFAGSPAAPALPCTVFESHVGTPLRRASPTEWLAVGLLWGRLPVRKVCKHLHQKPRSAHPAGTPRLPRRAFLSCLMGRVLFCFVLQSEGRTAPLPQLYGFTCLLAREVCLLGLRVMLYLLQEFLKLLYLTAISHLH